MNLNEFISQDESILFQKSIKFKKRKSIEIGCTNQRYFLLETSKKRIDFISAKNLDTIALERKKAFAIKIVSIFFFLVLAIYLYVYPFQIPLFLPPMILLLLVDIGVIMIITRKHFLTIYIGELKRTYVTKITSIHSIKEIIASLHSYGKDL